MGFIAKTNMHRLFAYLIFGTKKGADIGAEICIQNAEGEINRAAVSGSRRRL
jgi:hypothetical protein